MAAGRELDAQELAFVSMVFDKEARSLANREFVADLVHKALPEVKTQVEALPPGEPKPLSDTFVSRAEEMASEPLDEQCGRFLLAC
jgi:hypothetical protein